jgi:phosphatidylglycerol:prolipoprotein diacylglycerol transferase
LLLGRLANFTNNELWGRPTDVPWAVIFPGEAAQACPGVVGLCARHPSQLYEALLEGVVLGILLLVLAWRKGWLKRPGALTGVFLAGYGMSRAFVEFFRQPDMQFVSEDNPIGHALHFGTWGLTMGQTLSLPMIFAGLALILWAFRMQRRDRDQKTTETV